MPTCTTSPEGVRLPILLPVKYILVITLIFGLTTPLPAAPIIGIGGEGGFTYGFRDDTLTAHSLPEAGYLRSLGAHFRIPYRGFEIAAVGAFVWRTVNFTDSIGVAGLSFDDVVTSLSLRRMIPLRQFRMFAGFGPSVHRIRYSLDPPDLRPIPSRSLSLGAVMEAGAYWQTPLPRLEIGGGIRHHTTPDPTARFTLYWISFTVWSPRT